MKLRTANGNIIKIVSADSNGFSRSLNQKNVMAAGMAGEERISRAAIEKYAQNKTLLCHIDFTSCIDKKWVDGMVASGKADGYVNSTTQNLSDTMRKTGRDYVSVAVIAADKVEEAG